MAAPADRFPNGAKAKGYPYARRDGQKLANDLDDLFTTGLRVPLVITEFGTTLPPSDFPRFAWTGVDIHGQPGGTNCEAWTAGYYKYNGQVGKISPDSDSNADLFDWKIDGHWTKFTNRLCSTKQHLYCFED